MKQRKTDEDNHVPSINTESVIQIFKKYNVYLCFSFLENAMEKALKLSIIENLSIFHREEPTRIKEKVVGKGKMNNPLPCNYENVTSRYLSRK